MAQELPAAVIAVLMREMKELSAQPPDGIRVLFNEDNLSDIAAELDGPAGTPYEGGLFKMKLCIPHDFPNAPPKGYFVTKIFHPNIMAATGEICVNTLKKDWAPTHGLRHILMVVRCLLIAPFPESALNEEAAKMLLEQYDEYFRRAKLMTSIHAAPRAAAQQRGEAAAAAAGGAAGGAAPGGAGAGATGAEGGSAGAPPMGNATNTIGAETVAAAEGGKEGGPPLKKLDRKKSLKRL